jgi:hypothetical protein
VSLIQDDDADRSSVHTPSPDIYRAQHAAEGYIKNFRPTEHMKVTGCEDAAGNLLPPYRYRCEVLSGRKRYYLRIIEAVRGELQTGIETGGLPPRKDLASP